MRRLVLDPGHGGHDPGAVGATETLEKTVVLDIATTMADHLRQAGLEVQLTRIDDRYVALEDRVLIARALDADLMLSLHADWAPNPRARGVSAYLLDRTATDPLAAAIAARDNMLHRVAGVSLDEQPPVVSSILVDLAQRHARHVSRAVGEAIIGAAVGQMELLGNPLRAANFAVLRSMDVPSILLECGFLSNNRDEALLGNPERRKAHAHKLARAIHIALRSAPLDPIAG